MLYPAAHRPFAHRQVQHSCFERLSAPADTKLLALPAFLHPRHCPAAGAHWRERLEGHARLTAKSLHLDGIPCREERIVDAVLGGGLRGDLRSRPAQLIRNHVAILLRMDLDARHVRPLESSTVLRWYASLCAGLPMPTIDDSRCRRIESVCRQINSPPMQPKPAVEQVFRLYAALLSDPLFPTLNGLMSRLLARCHALRCRLCHECSAG